MKNCQSVTTTQSKQISITAHVIGFSSCNTVAAKHLVDDPGLACSNKLPMSSWVTLANYQLPRAYLKSIIMFAMGKVSDACRLLKVG